MKIKQFISLVCICISMNALFGQSLSEGLKQIENENYNAAILTFSSLNVRDPKNPIYPYYIGEIKYLLEENQAARDAYNLGLAISQKCDECRVGLAKLDLDAGLVGEAKKHIDAALKGNNKNHKLIALVGKTYLTSKKPNPDQAIEYLGRARDLDPKIASYWANLGDAYRMKGDFGNAMTSYETAVEKNKNNVEAYISMAKIWSASKQTDLAIEKLEQAIKLAPDYAPTYKDLYELYIRSGKLDKVIPILEKYVSLSGSDVDAKVRLVKFLTFQAKDFDRAIIEGLEVIATNPEQYTIHRWLAWSYGETGKYQESFDQSKLLFEAIDRDPTRKSFSSDYEYYAKASSKIGQLEVAEQMYARLIEKDTTRAGEIYGLLAKGYYDSKNYLKAIEWYRKKESSQSISNTDQYFMGLALYYTDHYHAADSSFAKVLELTPNFPNGWLFRARVANAIDSNQVQFLAKPFYEKFVELASIDPTKNKNQLIESYLYLGYYQVQQNDNRGAKSTFELVTALDPTNKTAVEYLAILNKGKQ
ncbi:MAG: tetratricopeptide repeat protein [Bacteroidota bacterium]|nr:tetratricopeptide repeat protein [Bacteroidota bacterium]